MTVYLLQQVANAVDTLFSRPQTAVSGAPTSVSGAPTTVSGAPVSPALPTSLAGVVDQLPLAYQDKALLVKVLTGMQQGPSAGASTQETVRPSSIQDIQTFMLLIVTCHLARFRTHVYHCTCLAMAESTN